MRTVQRVAIVVRVACLIFWCWSTLLSAIRSEWDLALASAAAAVFIWCWISEEARRRKAEEVVVAMRNIVGMQRSGYYEVVRKDDA